MCLSRAKPADNIAVFGQYLSVPGQVEDDIIECFHQVGGVRYEHFTGFHEVMEEDSGQRVLSCLIDPILPPALELAPWLESGIEVLEVGWHGVGR